MFALLFSPWFWVATAAALAISYGSGYMSGRDSRNAEIVALQSAILAANTVAEELRKRDPIVTERVVTQYRDRIKVVHEIGPTITEQVEVIKREAPDCTLPPAFVRLHNDSAASGSPQAGTAPGVNDSREGIDATNPRQGIGDISCAEAGDIIARNYILARSNAAQLEALQEWVRQTGR